MQIQLSPDAVSRINATEAQGRLQLQASIARFFAGLSNSDVAEQQAVYTALMPLFATYFECCLAAYAKEYIPIIPEHKQYVEALRDLAFSLAERVSAWRASEDAPYKDLGYGSEAVGLWEVAIAEAIGSLLATNPSPGESWGIPRSWWDDYQSVLAWDEQLDAELRERFSAYLESKIPEWEQEFWKRRADSDEGQATKRSDLARQTTTSPYSAADDRLYRLIPLEDFENLTDAELDRRHRRRAQQELGRPFNRNAFRCSLKRIREHHGYPRSSEVRKKSG